jgi:hypothetical protein
MQRSAKRPIARAALSALLLALVLAAAAAPIVYTSLAAARCDQDSGDWQTIERP